MTDSTFADFVQREGERLQSEREQISAHRKELGDKLAAIDRELVAVDAYEAAKSGKPLSGTRQHRAGRTITRTRRGSKREALLQII
jgi:hypothetical protein